MRVLVVEDEPHLADAIGAGLQRETMAVDVVNDGNTALDAEYDVVVLDRDRAGVHGDDVYTHLAAKHPATRVLMLTAAGALDDKVKGLELGADDHLPNPFEFRELVALLRALERRTQPARPPVLGAHGLMLDPFRRTVRRNDRLNVASRVDDRVVPPAVAPILCHQIVLGLVNLVT